MSATVALPLEPSGGWLPDGSRLTWLNAPSGKKDRLPVRAAEHDAVLARGGGAGEVSETCTVITTLPDHGAAPADQVRDTYLTRWSALETTFGEDKATIAGAGDRTSGPVLRSGSPRLAIPEAWAWLTATQLVRASAAAALMLTSESITTGSAEIPGYAVYEPLHLVGIHHSLSWQGDLTAHLIASATRGHDRAHGLQDGTTVSQESSERSCLLLSERHKHLKSLVLRWLPAYRTVRWMIYPVPGIMKPRSGTGITPSGVNSVDSETAEVRIAHVPNG